MTAATGPTGNAASPSSANADVWHDPRLAGWVGAVVLVLALALYVTTLDTGLRPDELRGGDLITHQYAQVQARPSNAPGYPLYTMGGWLWFRLTDRLHHWLNPVQRLAGYSTLWAVLALAVLYRILLRVTRGNWVTGGLITLFYAVTYFFWYYSVTTEQYTSAIFQTLLVVCLALRWEATARGDGSQPGVSDRYLVALGLVIGTCLANMLTTLFIAPPLLWFVLGRQPGLLRRPRVVMGVVLAAALPLLSYAFVYLRGAAHPEWWGQGNWPSAGAWFLDFLTTRQGRDELAPGLTLANIVTAEFPALIWGELTVPVLVAGLIGLWRMGRRQALFLGGTLAITLIFCWLYRFGNWFQVILPAYPLVLLGLAALAEDVWRHGPGRKPADDRRGSGVVALRRRLPEVAVRIFLVMALLGLVGYRYWLSLPRADQHRRPEDTGLDPGWALLADAPQAGATVVADTDEWLALEYLMTIWGAAPAVHPVAECPPAGAAVWQGASPVYVSRRAAQAARECLAGHHLSAAGAELIQAANQPLQALPPEAVPLKQQSVTPELELAGYQVIRREEPAPWHVALYWRANAPLYVDYTVSVRPWVAGAPVTDDAGKDVIQDHQPVWGVYPTHLWEAGELVRDDFAVTLPPGVVPDMMSVLVYRTLDDGGFENVGQVEVDLAP